MLRKFGAHVRQQFVGYLALFIALGGSAYAVAANSVGTAQLKNGAVTNPKLAPDSVGSGKVNDGSLAWDDLGGSLRTVVTGRCPLGSRGAPMDMIPGTRGTICMDHYARGPDYQIGAMSVCANAGLWLTSVGDLQLAIYGGLLAPHVRYWSTPEWLEHSTNKRYAWTLGTGGSGSVESYDEGVVDARHYYACVTPPMHS